LLIQNVLLLQRKIETDVKAMKEKMKKVIQKEREKHRTEMQNAKVRFPMHTTNAYRSTFIQSIAVLMSSDSLPSSHHDNLFLAFLAN